MLCFVFLKLKKKPDKRYTDTQEHYHHFFKIKPVPFARFEKDGGGDMQKDTDNNTHNAVKVLLQVPNGTVA